MEMLVSFLQSNSLNLWYELIVTIFTGGTMTAQTIALMEALKAIMEVAKQL